MAKGGYSPVPFSDVRVAGPFWHERLEVVPSRTIPSRHAKLAEVGTSRFSLRRSAATRRSAGAGAEATS